MNDEELRFSNCIDLLAASLGGEALSCSDDFFAGMDNLVKKGRGVFIADKFTERGKWMDGWESRRKREEGHDWCVLRLGVPGRIQAFDIDTNHFLGNHPSFAAVFGCWMPGIANPDDIPEGAWRPMLAQSALRRGSQNLFISENVEPVTHLRLDIFPDGGVARFRAHGTPTPIWEQTPDDVRFADRLKNGECDLAALRNGGNAKVCSDMFFGTMHNLIAPGRARVMSEGWETKRSRRAGFDWIIVELGAAGTPAFVVLDTHHFKGNFPESVGLQCVYAPGASVEELTNDSLDWKPLLARTKMSAHHEHCFRTELENHGPITHVRLDNYPDGGVSRMRVYGIRE